MSAINITIPYNLNVLVFYLHNPDSNNINLIHLTLNDFHYVIRKALNSCEHITNFEWNEEKKSMRLSLDHTTSHTQGHTQKIHKNI